MQPTGIIFTNLFFHLANVLLLFLLLRRMAGTPWQSGAVAALFAIHPLQLESVPWVAGRKDVSSSFFGFLTLGAYVRNVEQPDWKSYLFVPLLFALSLMSKPILVTLPFLPLLVDYWPLCRLVPKKGIGAHYSLEFAYFRSGRSQEAILEFKTALKINPRHPQARTNLELAYRAIEKPRGSVN